MHDYSELKRTRGYRVNQTLDAPILVFEYWELTEIFVGLGLILVLGVLFYEWALLCALLILTLNAILLLQTFGVDIPGLPSS